MVFHDHVGVEAHVFVGAAVAERAGDDVEVRA